MSTENLGIAWATEAESRPKSAPRDMSIIVFSAFAATLLAIVCHYATMALFPEQRVVHYVFASGAVIAICIPCLYIVLRGATTTLIRRLLAVAMGGLIIASVFGMASALRQEEYLPAISILTEDFAHRRQILQGASYMSIVFFFIVFFLCIIEAQNDKAKIAAQADSLRVITEQAPEIICQLDGRGGIRFINRELFGRSRNKLEGMRFDAFLSSSDRVPFLRHLRRAISTNVPQALEVDAGLDSANRVRFRCRFAPADSDPNSDDVIMIATDMTEHVQVEDALRRAEARWRSLLENAPDYIVITDQSGVIRYLNRGGPDLPQESFINRCCFDLVEDNYQEPARKAFEQAWNDGEAVELEVAFPRKDKDSLWFSCHVGPIIVGTQTTGLVVVFRDVTDQRRQAKALRESEERLKFAIAAGDIGLWDLRLDKGLYTGNEHWAGLLGYGPDGAELELNEWIQLIHPDDRESVINAFRGHLDSRTSMYQSEFRMLSGTGEYRWILSTGRVVERDKNREPVRISGTHVDITDRKAAEEQLRATKSRLTETQRVGHIGSWELDTVNIRLWWSEEQYRIFGVDPETFTPSLRSVLRMIPREERKSSLRKLRAALQADAPFAIELPITGPDGQPHLIALRGHAERDEFGRAARILGTAQDITERSEAEEERRRLEFQMQQTQKLESLGVLAGGIAHDFNNLLVGIIGHTDLALAELDLDSPVVENLSQIENAARRAADLAKHMLAYSGGGTFTVQPLELSSLVEEMAHLLSSSVSKKVTLRPCLADDLPSIEADATQVGQVVMNLVTNASDAIGDNEGAIHLKTGLRTCDREYLNEGYFGENLPVGDYVYLEVSDSGDGMDAETLRRMFEPFFTTKFTGRGLGLATVMGIARGHKAALRVSSELGHGTRFTVLFPACDRPESALQEVTPAIDDTRNGKGTVLVVDDEEMVRRLAEVALERMGYEVILANDGQEGVDLFRERGDEVDAVLLDMTMPRMNGDEAYEAMQAIDPEVRVVLTSGYTEQDATQHIGASSLAGFLQKPFKIAALSEAIQKAITQT
jgi:PAS domain S-box-containing protein